MKYLSFLKNRRLFKFIIIFLTLGVLVSAWFLFLDGRKPTSKEICRSFEITSGENVWTIANRLESLKIISSKVFFIVSAVLSNDWRKIKAGQYEFCDLTSREVLRMIVRGDVDIVKAVILEGWGNRQIAAYLAQKDLGEEGVFLQIFNRSDFDWVAMFPELTEQGLFSHNSINSLQGFLFPDTYQIYKGESEEKIVAKMIGNFQKKINFEIKDQLIEKKVDLMDIIIVASLLEREVRTFKDKQIVAGIFWKRLQNNWPLQICATVAYALNKPGASLTLEDLKTDHPYNTYRNKGLPPGPICNPGIDSIKAAIDYKESNYWYYLSKPNGETVFSATLSQHNLAKARYLK